MEEGKGFNIKYLIIGILFTLQTVGIYEHVFNIDDNNCEMTYMWQTPEYIPVSLPADISSQFSRYNLYSYGEGPMAALLRTGQYAGQPVLFVPGNLGSYKQVRSLASVAYRKSLDEDESRQFDFFTADLAEDLAALYGPSLEEQTAFINAVIPVIQSLYLAPKPVILIGHSIGGVVARAALTGSVTGADVPLIVTLATPHTAPPISVDPFVYNFYDKVNSFWALEREAPGAVSDVTLISVGGGRNDVLVSPLAVASPFAHVVATSTAVPGCWATTDHLSVVWCKQLVQALVRGLYDSVDHKTGLLHKSISRLSAVFDYQLITRHSGKHFVTDRHKRQLKLASEGQWSEITSRQWERTVAARSALTYFMIPLTGSPQSKYSSAAVRVRGLEEKEWILACTAAPAGEGVKTCSSAMNLSKKFGRLLGGGGKGSGRGKLAEVDLKPLLEEGYTHLVVNVPSSENKVTVSVDVHSETDRRTSIAAPRLVFSFKPTPVIKSSTPKALVQEIVFEGLNEPWHSYELTVLPSVSCPINSSRHQPPQVWVSAHTSHRLALVPHSVSKHEYQYRLEQDEVSVLPSTRSLDDDSGNAEPVRGDLTVTLLLDQRCLYSVSVKASLAGTFRRMLVLYGGQVPAFLVCHLLLALAMQLKSVGDARYCPSVLTSLLALTPMVVVPFVKLSAMALKKMEVYNDQQMLTDSGLDLGVLPIFMFLSWLPLTLLAAGGVWLAVLGAGNVVHSAALRLFGASLGVGEVAADIALTGLSKVPAVVAVALLAVAFSTCGALAMALATAFYFIQLFDMYKDHIKKVILKLIPRLDEETVPDPPAPASATAAASATDTPATDTTTADAATASTSSSSNTNASTGAAGDASPAAEGVVVTRKVVPQSSETLSLYLHLSLMLLCLVATLLQVPVLITWAVRTKQGDGLPVDPSLWPSVACLASLAVLWQVNPSHDRAHYKLVGQIVHFAAVMCLLFASLSAYRLPYVIAATLAAVALHQLFAPIAIKDMTPQQDDKKKD